MPLLSLNPNQPVIVVVLLHVCALCAVRNVSITRIRALHRSSTTIQALTTTTSTRYSTSTSHVRCSTVCVVTCCLAGGAACCRVTASSLRLTISMHSSISSKWATASSHSSSVDSSSEVWWLFWNQGGHWPLAFESPWIFIFQALKSSEQQRNWS